MLKLFIVDDEPDTREGLRYYFDWAKYNIEVIGEADDGIPALESILKDKPDIILTDVRMPDMDGIELANKLRELQSDIKIIFISGYDDVAYLRSALKLDAVDYILKPVDLNELSSVIEKVINLINEQNDEKKLIYEMNLKLMESMPTLREKFFMTLVRDGIDNSEDIDERIKFLELKLPSEADYCVFVLSVDDKADRIYSISEKDKQLVSFSVINICDELVNKVLNGYTFENRKGEYVCILWLNQEEDEDKLYTLISDIKDSLLMYLKLSVTIGVGLTVNGLKNVVKSYSIAFENVNQKLFLGKNKIITMDSLETMENYVYKFDFSKLQQLVNILKSSDKEKIISSIEDIFMEISKYNNGNRGYCLNICLQLILTASRQLMELKITINEKRFNEEESWKHLLELETLQDMKLFITEYFLTVSRFIEETRNKKSRNVIDQIKDVIHKGFSNNITVNEIAKEVFLSTTYLCMIFKQETGQTVNDYVTKVRIEKAKELLIDPKNKLYDICYQIGYTEPGYFSKIFKKHTGLSPTEYREKII